MSVVAAAEERTAPSRVARRTTPAAALAALGIVYGDLGTSPLYTLQTIIQTVGGQFTPEAALGVLSLIFWALIITISVKYCLFVMRADNHGEGGILALMPLVGATRVRSRPRARRHGLVRRGPDLWRRHHHPAISVLSALEGVNVATEVLEPYVMPMAVAILICLFAVQGRGTARIGNVFGPVMLLWFVVIAALGVGGILRHPRCSPRSIRDMPIGFLAQGGWGGFAVLGGVFLAITGGEALYADMGHIGRNPIRTTWYGIVLPALAAQLCRPDGAAARRAGPRRQSLLQARSGLGDFPARAAGDGGDHHRQPGDHHRLVLADASGDAARLVPGLAHPPDLGRGIRPDLRAVRELDDDAVDDRPDGQLRQLRPPRRRLWHRRLDHDAADDGSALQRDA